jgi:hypothetical protein
LVDPPDAATPAMAFSNASRVRMLRAVWPRLSTSITSLPQSYATASLWLSIAGTLALPNGEMPSISPTIAIVLAVNWPPQAPGPGQAASSTARRPASSSLPAECAPTASNTSWMVRSLPCRCPGAIEPP